MRGNVELSESTASPDVSRRVATESSSRCLLCNADEATVAVIRETNLSARNESHSALDSG